MYHIRTKNKKDTQFFAKARPWVWQVLPKNLCNYHGMSFAPQFCHSLGHVYTKEFIRYCSALNIEETWKWYRLGGWYPGEEKCKTKSWKTNTTFWMSSKRRLTVHLSSHTTISGPQTRKLTSRNRLCLFLDFCHTFNHNFTLSYSLLLTQNNRQFSSDNFLHNLTPDTKLKPCLSMPFEKSTKKCSAV